MCRCRVKLYHQHHKPVHGNSNKFNQRLYKHVYKTSIFVFPNPFSVTFSVPPLFPCSALLNLSCHCQSAFLSPHLVCHKRKQCNSESVPPVHINSQASEEISVTSNYFHPGKHVQLFHSSPFTSSTEEQRWVTCPLFRKVTLKHVNSLMALGGDRGIPSLFAVTGWIQTSFFPNAAPPDDYTRV